jgi:G3E family GTPase
MCPMLPVTIITGFLGSGKTTLLNFLLRQEALKQSLVIINEFGEVPIDHLIVSSPAENVRLLSNGCLCCQVKGEFADTLSEAARQKSAGELPPFDRILIETSGLADPVPILKTIVTDDCLSLLYSLDAVIVVMDAVNLLQQVATQNEARKQIAISDIMLLSKTDLPSAADSAELEAAVRGINGGADILPVLHGAIDPNRLLGLSTAHRRKCDLVQWLDTASAAAESARDRPSHTHDIQTFSLCLEVPVGKAGLMIWLSLLANFRGRQLLRVKGVVNVAGQPYMVHVVQSVVHELTPLEAWPTSDHRTRIVFIGRALDRSAIEKTIAVLDTTEALDNSPWIDAAGYARFREAARHFTHVPLDEPRGNLT